MKWPSTSGRVRVWCLAGTAFGAMILSRLERNDLAIYGAATRYSVSDQFVFMAGVGLLLYGLFLRIKA